MFLARVCGARERCLLPRRQLTVALRRLRGRRVAQPAVERLGNEGANLAVNLGTGRGTSIREILDAIGRITGRTVPVEMRARRAGDPPALYADPSLAAEKLGFLALYSDLDTIIRSAAPTFGLELRG